jgi:hypothetical protein
LNGKTASRAKRYRTAPRPEGARAAGVDPRPGEDRARDGQKTYQDAPSGVKANRRSKRKTPASGAKRHGQ